MKPESYPDDPAILNMAIMHSKAQIFYQRVLLLELNYHVFERNYQVLKKVLVKAQSPDAFYELWVMGKEKELNFVMSEIIRLFHNFVASAITYVDHTRAVMRDWYENTDFLKEYQSEIDRRFVNNTITMFIEDLRNFTLHYQLPLTTAQVMFETEPETGKDKTVQTFLLEKSDLLRWKKWSDKGKPFLNQSEEQINLLNLIDSYYSEVNSFFIWIMDHLEELHAEDIKWLNEMNAKLRKALELLRNRPVFEE